MQQYRDGQSQAEEGQYFEHVPSLETKCAANVAARCATGHCRRRSGVRRNDRERFWLWITLSRPAFEVYVKLPQSQPGGRAPRRWPAFGKELRLTACLGALRVTIEELGEIV